MLGIHELLGLAPESQNSSGIDLTKDGQRICEALLTTNFRIMPLNFVFNDYQLQDLNVHLLPISTRSRNALLRHGINNLSDVASMAVMDLQDIKFMGKNMIIEVLFSYLEQLRRNTSTEVTISDFSEASKEVLSVESTASVTTEPSLTYAEFDFGYELRELLNMLSAQTISLILKLKQEHSRVLEEEDWSEYGSGLPPREFSEANFLRAQLRRNRLIKKLSTGIISKYGIFTYADIILHDVLFKIRISGGADTVNLIDICEFAGGFNSRDGYIYVSSSVDLQAVDDFYELLTEENDISGIAGITENLRGICSDKALQYASEIVKNRNLMLHTGQADKDLSDLEGDDIWFLNN